MTGKTSPLALFTPPEEPWVSQLLDAKAIDEHHAALAEYTEARALWETAITRLSNARTAVAWTKGRLQQRGLSKGIGRPRGAPPAEGTQANQVLRAMVDGTVGMAKPLAKATGLDRQRINVLLCQLKERGFVTVGAFGVYKLTEAGERSGQPPAPLPAIP